MHISNVYQREEFRHHSYVSAHASGVIVGFGVEGYVLALSWIASNLDRRRGAGARSRLDRLSRVATTNDLKNGLVLNIDGQLWTVTDFQHVKPGKGGAFVRTTLKNVLSGKVVDRTFNAGTKVETANVDKRAMTFLYREGDEFVFMDADTYDQIPVPAATVGDAAELPARQRRGRGRGARRRAAVHRAADLGRADHLAHRPGPAG